MTDHPVVTPEFLAQGGPAELIQAELARLFADIADPNTEPKTVRKVVIEVVIAPNERRESAEVTVAVKSKLAGNRPSPTTWYFGIREGRQVAVEHDPRQLSLNVEPAGPVEVNS